MDLTQSSHILYPIQLVYDKAPVPGWEDVRQTLDVHSLYWIVSGEGFFQADGERYEVGEGVMAYLKPGLKLNMKSAQERPLHIKMILFHAIRVDFEPQQCLQSALMDDLSLPFLQLLPREQVPLMNERIKLIAQYWSPARPASHPDIQYELASLIMQLSRLSAPLDRYEEACTSIRRWIDIHYGTDLRIEQLADSFGISSVHLRKWFLKELGLSPKAYLNRIRNEQAKKYLALTAEPLKAIADACGFADEQHFGKMFRQWNQTSPGAYRRMSMQGNRNGQ
ncbi:AraC family transcriptional regulator [Paenibacillus aestuarii]|uniref:AraC family transcriptional regulator n=1 Tax=Paenibacillus aestuarii TaxID=516965 RepID=A0ABW0K9L6_9BACL|nr:AraC family transcriptional regulator [Paenibacillus aestuarii]